MCNNIKSDHKRQKQRLVLFLLRIGKKFDTGKSYWTEPHRTWLKLLQFKEEMHKFSFEIRLNAILEQESKLEILIDKIKKISAEARYAERVSKLRCFK